MVGASRALTAAVLGAVVAIPLPAWPQSPSAASPSPAEAALIEMETLGSEHFRLQVPRGASGQVQEIALDLETVWDTYEELVGALLPLHAHSGRLDIHLLPGPAALDQHVETNGLRRSPFPGAAVSLADRTLAMDGSSLLGHSDRAVLFHGVIHLCNQVALYEAEVAGSWWVREGLATYVMQMRFDRDGFFHPDTVRRSEAYVPDLTPGGRAAGLIPWALEPKNALDAIGRARRNRRHVPLEVLLDHPADRAWEDDAMRDRAAVQSWALVHLLLHGNAPELPLRFARFLEQERRGRGGAATFRRTVAGDLPALERLLFQHARTMQ